VDRAADAAAGGQRLVRCIDDGVGVERGDVRVNDFDPVFDEPILHEPIAGRERARIKSRSCH